MCSYYKVNIVITTEVEARVDQVREGFTQDLFLKLNPPFPKVRLERFDGCTKGDIVEMELNFGLWKERWRSDITDSEVTDSLFRFIDVGTTLPFPFSKWRHHHIVKEVEGKTIIVDDIEYFAKNNVLSALLFPLLYLQFLYRKPVYKKTFSKT